MLSLQSREILLKGLPDCGLAFSQGIWWSYLIFKVDCVKWKSTFEGGDSRLTRKYKTWKTENFDYASSLTLALMYPISRLRLESHFAEIRLQELPGGFRVLSAESVSIESLPDNRAQTVRDSILYNQTNQPENVCCVAVFAVFAINAAKNSFLHEGYGFGPYSNLAAIQEEASFENGRQAELIKMLNREK
jgi:hypothetical protein